MQCEMRWCKYWTCSQGTVLTANWMYNQCTTTITQKTDTKHQLTMFGSESTAHVLQIFMSKKWECCFVTRTLRSITQTWAGRWTPMEYVYFPKASFDIICALFISCSFTATKLITLQRMINYYCISLNIHHIKKCFKQML